jgi:hypothetical protein
MLLAYPLIDRATKDENLWAKTSFLQVLIPNDNAYMKILVNILFRDLVLLKEGDI